MNGWTTAVQEEAGPPTGCKPVYLKLQMFNQLINFEVPQLTTALVW